MRELNVGLIERQQFVVVKYDYHLNPKQRFVVPSSKKDTDKISISCSPPKEGMAYVLIPIIGLRCASHLWVGQSACIEPCG
jgi:hypothetical protein